MLFVWSKKLSTQHSFTGVQAWERHGTVLQECQETCLCACTSMLCIQKGVCRDSSDIRRAHLDSASCCGSQSLPHSSGASEANLAHVHRCCQLMACKHARARRENQTGVLKVLADKSGEKRTVCATTRPGIQCTHDQSSQQDVIASASGPEVIRQKHGGLEAMKK